MRKIFAVIAAVPLLASVASATDWPKAEVFLGYNFVRFNPDSAFVPSFNANGGSASFTYNFTRFISAEFEGGAVHKGNIGGVATFGDFGTFGGIDNDTTVVHYVVGPRFTYHNHSRWWPYAHALFGGASALTSAGFDVLGGGVVPPGVVVPPDQTVRVRVPASHTGFAMFIGGGLDVKVSKHFTVRPAGVDYYLTRIPTNFLPGGSDNRSNFRYMAGFSFLFGAQ